MRRALALLGLLALVRPAFADDRPPARPPPQLALESQDPRVVAWGLYDAILGRRTELAREIPAVLRRFLQAEGQVVTTRTLAIDAAIALDAELPPDLLVAAAKDTGVVRRLLLASKNPDSCRDELRGLLRERLDDDEWTATCNLLGTLRDPALGAHLLSLVRLEADVIAVDPGDGRFHPGGECGIGAGGGCACGQMGKQPEGWPPRIVWTVGTSAADSDLVVVRGRTTIYAAWRAVRTGEFVCRCLPTSGWSQRYHAEQLLADLLGWPVDGLRHGLSQYDAVEFRSGRDWSRATEAIERERVRVWGALLVSCFLQGVLRIEDAMRLPPRIRWRVHDERKVKEPKLEPPPRYAVKEAFD